jgi:FkbM family methyltransferase
LITVERHGHEIVFPDVPGGTEVPYTYRDFESGGWYEADFLEHIRSVGREGVYVDIGAHMATATTFFAVLCPSTRVHAIEPVTRFADQVDRVIAANGLGDKVVLHRVGVSDEPGTATNHLAAEHQQGFHEAGAARSVDETFEVTTLDDLISDPVAVIKIDVEGMEGRVLRGADRILRNDKPTVYLEALDRAALREVKAALAPYGYRPTGAVFNSSPTFEFSTSAPPWAAVKVVAYQVVYAIRRLLRKIAKKVGVR